MMRVRTPPTLMKLARQALLRNEALAISALEDLPMELFPALFKDAFNSKHTRIVKEMVAAWPFPCLPVGTLMETTDLEIFQAVLDGVDMQLARMIHPRSEKLQVLDLRRVQHEFWNMWTGREDGYCSAKTVGERPVVKVLPRYALRRQRLKVVTDLDLRFRLNKEQACFWQWAQQRKGSLHLNCMKMEIWDVPVCIVKEILNVFQPGHIEELELNPDWNVCTLASLAPYLEQMRSLRKLSLKNIYSDSTDKPWCVSTVLAQFSKFNCLQHLSMNDIFFTKGNMKQILRCLKTPLETLSIRNGHLSQSDWIYFPRSHSLCQLKHLDLRDTRLFTSCMKHLGVLLETVAGTLESLDLQGCDMEDSQLTDLLPALSKCSQLTRVNFSHNDFSMPTLKDLLRHTANLTKINKEYYPAPQECYDSDSDYISVKRYAQLCLELMDTLRALRQPGVMLFSTSACHECGEECRGDEEYCDREQCSVGELELCPCWD